MKRKGIHKSFWYGVIAMYIYTFTLMIMEMNIPGMTYAVKIGGAPASMFYNAFMGVVAINVFLSWLWFWVPEQEDKRIAASQGVKKDGS